MEFEMGDQAHDPEILTHLLIDFIIDTGLNFSAVDNLKFHKFVNYVKPGVKLPTSVEVTTFYDTYYEEITGLNDNVLVNVGNDGDRNSEEYIHVDEAGNQIEYQSRELPNTEPHTLKDSMEVNSNELTIQIQNMESTDQNLGLGYGAASEKGIFPSEQLQMSDERLAIGTKNHKEEKCLLINCENLNNIMPEAPSSGSLNSDEDVFILQESSSESSRMGQESPSFQDSNSYASSSLVPALHRKSFGNMEIKQENLTNLPYPEYLLGCKVHKIEKNIVTLKSIPGYLQYPCLVCCERKKGRHMREVEGYHAYIMIFACIKNGYYSKEKGMMISRLRKFYSCRSHLDDMYNSACKHMGIAKYSTDVHTGNKKIVNAFPLINEIKSSRETIKRNNSLGSFIGLVRTFCETYKRDYHAYNIVHS
ncbi:hypothetical protein GCK72_024545 [Caenorhabditis remanei]|uniref:Lin-15A/B-like domain-containing protein n=1 Tax=Caenorhabditis remanei TaxID=31234 RepID=A0A6A5FZI4_CAERE|nr:hypothetical protein GCK72_024545 [Caenorhabditis remanei]KAF1748078.1 hypothetical protein GCK72_024545 [Caenorhabditis remanei]